MDRLQGRCDAGQTPSQIVSAPTTDEPATNEPATDDSPENNFSWPFVAALAVVVLGPYLAIVLSEFAEALKVKWSRGPPSSPE